MQSIELESREELCLSVCLSLYIFYHKLGMSALRISAQDLTPVMCRAIPSVFLVANVSKSYILLLFYPQPCGGVENFCKAS